MSRPKLLRACPPGSPSGCPMGRRCAPFGRQKPIIKNKVHIMVDCQSAIITAASNEIPKNFSILSQDIRRKAKHLNVPIKLYWIAGHAKVKGNEKADQKAKEGANMAKTDTQNNKSKYISLSEAKNRIKLNAIRRWNQKWQRQHSKSLKQTITVGSYKSTGESTSDRDGNSIFSMQKSKYLVICVESHIFLVSRSVFGFSVNGILNAAGHF